ncbi:putative expansin, cellulose-binding-like domain-containing protein [Helianthus debilis subsp. tardiflorus]
MQCHQEKWVQVFFLRKWVLVVGVCDDVAGAGDINNTWVKGTKTGCISMSHNWGASYQAFTTL